METVSRIISQLLASVSKVVVGNVETLERAVEVLIAGGHILDEDEPGVGKTLMMESIARASGLDYKWIQGTPDLRPNDITGGVVLNRQENTWELQKGPMFANIVVMDEVNRTSPKTQAATLEAMQNRRVTIEGEQYRLPDPHMVLATQNTRNSSDVYELPEAMLDRFSIRLTMQELSVMEEALVYKRTRLETPEAESVPGFDILLIRKEYENIHVDPRFRTYVASLMAVARNPESVGLDCKWNQMDYRLGRSTRPGEWLIRLAMAGAVMEGKRFITSGLLQDRLHSVLNHRLKNDHGGGINDNKGLDWVRNAYVPALIQAVPVERIGEDELEEAADKERNK